VLAGRYEQFKRAFGPKRIPVAIGRRREDLN
jgi:hypothetical protein